MPWWPGGWRTRLASGLLNPSGGVLNLGVWRTYAEAERYVQNPTTDPVVAGLDENWGTVAREMVAGAGIEWAPVIESAHPLALDHDFWADIDSGRPLPEM
jgi:hypothetical protein